MLYTLRWILYSSSSWRWRQKLFGEDLDDRDKYEGRIEQGDFDRGVDDHEITPIPHVDDMAECDKDDADTTVRVQHVPNVTPVYEPSA